MFSFWKFYLLDCVGYFNVTKGRESLVDLFLYLSIIVDSEVFEATIWNLQTPPRPFLNSSLF